MKRGIQPYQMTVLVAAVAVAAGLVLLAASVQAASTTFTYSTGANWSTATWNKSGGTDDPGTYPNHTGDVVNFTGSTIALDTSVTTGQLLKNADTGGSISITASGSNTITMDNTGGANNVFGTGAAIINNSGNNTFNVGPDIVFRNTDLIIASTGSGQPSINGAITAATPQALFLRVTATGGAGASLNGNIGESGSAIAVSNVGTGTAPIFLSGALGGSVTSLTQNAATTLALSSNNSVYGATVITSGILSVGGAFSGSASPNAGAAGNLGFGDVTIATAGSLEFNSTGAPVVTNNLSDAAAGQHGNLLIGVGSATTAYLTGSINLSGSAKLDSTHLSTNSNLVFSPWTVPGSSATTQTLSGALGDSNGTQTTLFIKSGTGVLVTSGTASTSINECVSGGTWEFDYTTNNTAKISTGHSLRMDGGTLLLHNGSTTEGTSSGLHINAGGSTIDRDAGTSKVVTTISARGIGGTLNLANATGVAFGTTTVNDAGGILGAYVTVGGADWGVSGNPVAALAAGSYTPYPGSGAGSGTANYLLTGSGANASFASANTIKINSATSTPQSLTLGTPLTLTDGGLMYVGSDAYAVTGSTLKGMSAKDLIIQQWGNGTLTVGSILADNGTSSLTKAGSGKLVLTNAGNSYAGATFINAGTLSIDSISELGTAAGTLPTNAKQININNGALQLTGASNSVSTNRTVAVGGNGGTFDVLSGNTLTLSGVISNVVPADGEPTMGALIKTNSGTLYLSNSANSYLGPTIISGGTLQTDSVKSEIHGGTASGIGASPATATFLIFDGGTLKYTGTGDTTDRLFTVTANGGAIDSSNGANAALTWSGNAYSGANAVAFSGSGARTFTLSGSSSGANTFTPILGDGTGGATSLTKSGTGTWLLNNANTFTGNTTITGGTLKLAAANSIAASGRIIVGDSLANNTAILDLTSFAPAFHVAANQTLGGYGTVQAGAGGLTVDATATLAPGNSAGALTVTGAITMASGSILSVELNNAAPGAGYDQLLLTSTAATDLTLASGAVLNLALNFTPALQSFVIVDNSSAVNGQISGTFILPDSTQLLDGTTFALSGQRFRINYNVNGGLDGNGALNDVVLTHLGDVPEPATLSLLALGGISVLRRRRN